MKTYEQLREERRAEAAEYLKNHQYRPLVDADDVKVWRCQQPGTSAYAFDIMLTRYGIAIVRAYTSAAWFHEHAVKADAMLFPRGKTKFVRPDGSVGGSPGHGVVLLAKGARAKSALQRSGLGLYIELHP